MRAAARCAADVARAGPRSPDAALPRPEAVLVPQRVDVGAKAARAGGQDGEVPALYRVLLRAGLRRARGR